MRFLRAVGIASIVSCGDGSSQQLAVIAIEPASIDLGVVEIGAATAPVDVTIRNTGPISTAVVLSTDSAELVVISNDCRTLEPQATCAATLVLTPATPTVMHELRAFTLDGEAAVAPVIAQGAYRLTIDRTGDGVVSSNPVGIECGTDCSSLFLPSSAVALSATPAATASFDGWSGACAGIGACEVILTAHATVGATFRSAIGLTILTDGLGAGAVILDGDPNVLCVNGPCVMANTAGRTVSLTAHPLPGATFSGWSGACTGNTTCSIAVPADGAVSVTATFSPDADVSLVRGIPWNGYTVAAARASDGVVILGARSAQNGGWDSWLIKYLDDGSLTPLTQIAGLLGRDVAVDAMGAVVVAAGEPIPLTDDSTLTLVRFDASGQEQWRVAPGGAPMEGLALDSAANIYVGGNDGSPYVVSYTSAGVERWRRRPNADALTSLAARNGVIVAAGTSGRAGWIGTYDVDGDSGWERSLFAQVGNVFEMVMEDVAIDGDGDVIFASRSGAASCEVGAIDATGTSEQWRRFAPQSSACKFARLALRVDDSIEVWLVGDPGSTYDSTLARFADGGTPMGETVVDDLSEIRGFASDGGGTVYLVSTSGRLPYRWPVLQRRP